MKRALSQLFAGSANLKGRIVGIYALLIGANLAAWIWAVACFHNYPVLLGTALLAYSFGLRHAVDADHIAAIDNVTRKPMQQGQRPVGVGLYFSAAPRPPSALAMGLASSRGNCQSCCTVRA